MKRAVKTFILIMLCGIMMAGNDFDVFASDVSGSSGSGKLSVEGTRIVDQNGEAVALQGVSLHGLTWFPQYVNRELFAEVSEWGANLIRLPAYSSEYVKGEKMKLFKLIGKGIEYALEQDMYVIVDWHILDDNDPNTNLSEALEFWETIAREYADVPNVIYEICNEPNGAATWNDILRYAECVIPVIKKYNEDALILLGTPDYSQDIEAALESPVTGYSNIMYSFHFYSASHKEDMRNRLKKVIDSGLPVFVSECGVCEASGSGAYDLNEAAEWFAYLKENSIPYAVWNLSNKNEASAMIRSAVRHSGRLKDSELTVSGQYVKALLSGKVLTEIDPETDKGFCKRLFHYCENHRIQTWSILLCICAIAVVLNALIFSSNKKHKKPLTYDDYQRPYEADNGSEHKNKRSNALLIVSSVFSLMYLCWRVLFSVPVGCGVMAVIANLVLLFAETIGFVESQIHYHALLQAKNHPLPAVRDDEFPDVDIFISTYNEPVELLRKTVIGCRHIKYPDPDRVHIYDAGVKSP